MSKPSGKLILKLTCLHLVFWAWWAVSVSWPWLLAKATGTTVTQIFQRLATNYLSAVLIYVSIAGVLILVTFPLLTRAAKQIARKHSQLNSIDRSVD